MGQHVARLDLGHDTTGLLAAVSAMESTRTLQDQLESVWKASPAERAELRQDLALLRRWLHATRDDFGNYPAVPGRLECFLLRAEAQLAAADS